MRQGNIRKEHTTEKKRICRELKKIGVSKKELAGISGLHYQTIKWALNPNHPGWSQRVVDAANEIINPVNIPQ